MAKLTVKHTYYAERLEPIMAYEIEVNGASYDKGHQQTYNVVEGVYEGLNRLLKTLSMQGTEGEAVTVTGAELTEGAQQYLSDVFTSGKEIASITFE